MTDIAATLSSLCKVPYPNACTGEPLFELFRIDPVFSISYSRRHQSADPGFFSQPLPKNNKIGSCIRNISSSLSYFCIPPPTARGTEIFSLTALDYVGQELVSDAPLPASR